MMNMTSGNNAGPRSSAWANTRPAKVIIRNCSSGYGNWKNTKSTLAAANMQLQAVLDAATEVAIIATDREGMITIFNKGAEKMLGYTEEEVVGKFSSIILHLPEEIKERGSELGKESGQPLDGFDVFIELIKSHGSDRREWSYLCKDGKQLLVLLTATAIHNPAGEITGFLGIANDITEQGRWSPNCCSLRRWSPSVSWQAAWPMISTMCSALSSVLPACCR
jgi:PAS domain S-box-containing protein